MVFLEAYPWLISPSFLPFSLSKRLPYGLRSPFASVPRNSPLAHMGLASRRRRLTREHGQV